MLRHFPGTHITALAGLATLVGVTLLLNPGSNQSKTSKTFDVAPIPELSSSKKSNPGDYAQAGMGAPSGSLSATAATDLQSILGFDLAVASREDPSEAEASDNDGGLRASELEWQRFRVESGDSLSSLFGQAGLDDRRMYDVLNGEGSPDKFTNLQVGREIEFGFDEDDKLAMIVLHNSPTTKLKAVRSEGDFHTREAMREPDIKLAYASGEIQTSYVLATNRAGLDSKVRNNLSRIFGWRVDFSKDLRKGDRFGVLYEEQYLDGEKIGHGRILAATFSNGGEEYSAALYTDSDGQSSYYTPKGESLRKAFLRAPLQYKRISSHFDPDRQHPVLDRKRPHEGTDFAASSGTPVKASGDGRISYVGRDGGYGRTIRIDHGNEVTTVYSHLRGYKQSLRHGQTVSQGDVIGYVGTSGLSTGPHLHYEYRVRGHARNPLHVDLPDADPVPDSEMAQFRSQTNPLLARLSEEDESFQLALAEE